jgi:pyrroline-5-carboxylate reductase
MLAAVSESDQRKILGISKLIRIMPNLPVKYKKGITLISSDSAPSEMKQVKNLFSLVGLSQEVEECELEELTLLTGSGPALFYEFTRLLAASFTSLPLNERERLARMVLSGSGVSLESAPDELDQMIGQVTSKAGVTIAVLDEWRDLKLNKLILAGIAAGKKRSVQISQTLRDN